MDTQTVAEEQELAANEDGAKPSERGTELLIISSVLLGICWILVLLRTYVRHIKIKNFAADDAWMIWAMILYTGYTINNIYGIIHGGTGQHVTMLSTEKIYIGLRAWYISEVMYAPVSATVRTSLALLLLRISVKPWHEWVVIVNLAVVWIISIVFTFVCTFQCDPPSHFYDQVLGLEGRCLHISLVPDVTIAHSVVGAACDFVFAAMPIMMLWNVRLNKRTKVSVALLLGMGFISGIALFVRIPYVKVLEISPDFLFETIDVAIWSIMEPSLGIVAGCMATLRPLLKGFGFGRDTTRTTTYFERRTATTVASSRRTNSKYKKFNHYSLSPIASNVELTDQTARNDSDGTHNLSSADSKLGPLTPMPTTVSTNIGGARDPWTENDIQGPGLGSRGITVHTSIHTESTYTTEIRGPQWRGSR